MIKALIKKQMLELISSFIGKQRRKTTSTKSAIVIFLVLIAVASAASGYLISLMAETMLKGLAQQELTWLYFSFFGVLSFGLGLIGSVFVTYTTLYSSKDNDLLLSMPVKPGYILLARTLGLYIITAVFEAIILVPAEIRYLIFAGFDAIQFLLFLATLLALPFFTFVFSALFGYLIALIAPKVKHKNVVTVLVSLVFVALYFYLYSQFNKILTMIIANAESVSTVVKFGFFPFYALGCGMYDSPLWYLVFLGLALAAFAVVYFLLQRSFIRLATSTAKTARKEYKGEVGRQSSVDGALLKKEFSRYFSSPSYLLNTGISVLILIIAAVSAFFNRTLLDQLLVSVPPSLVPLVIIAAVGFLGGLSSPTAPSISLEGQTLPILRSLPVASKAILQAKLNLHLIVIALPVFLCNTALCFLLVEDKGGAAIASVSILPLLHLAGVLGLIFNLRHPFLDWANEAVAVKQSSSVLFAMLSILGVLALAVAPAVVLTVLAEASVYAVVLLVLGVFLAVDAVMTTVLYKWGPGKLETL